MTKDISNDGREIWDWAGRLGEQLELQARAQELRRAVSRVESTCGSCALWMTRGCPMERPAGWGRYTGPSGDAKKCGAFEMSSGSAKSLDYAKAELAEILTKLGPPNIA